MNILIACEESQRVCTAFREKGHNAFSCDIQNCSGGHPEWHIMCDVTEIINGFIQFVTLDGKLHSEVAHSTWDMIIAHPPCTYLSNAGARHLYKNGQFNEERYKMGLKGKEFFMEFYNANCEHICIENPVPSKVYGLPPYTQIIEPYMFGHPYSKKTCLWLKNLPQLQPTKIIDKDKVISTKDSIWFNHGGKDRAKQRSKTFIGIAKAMAAQWG